MRISDILLLLLYYPNITEVHHVSRYCRIFSDPCLYRLVCAGEQLVYHQLFCHWKPIWQTGRICPLGAYGWHLFFLVPAPDRTANAKEAARRLADPVITGTADVCHNHALSAGEISVKSISSYCIRFCGSCLPDDMPVFDCVGFVPAEKGNLSVLPGRSCRYYVILRIPSYVGRNYQQRAGDLFYGKHGRDGLQIIPEAPAS